MQKDHGSENLLDKSVALFSYLRELTQLRSATIRNLDAYENVLWFCEIPQEQECFTQIWGASRENREDIWLEIKKPKLPPIPALPEKIKRWAREGDLVDTLKERPSLLERIPVDAPANQDSSDQQTSLQWLELKDFPEVQSEWAEYVESKWKLWAAEFRRIKRIQEIYSKLFEIYQTQKRLGEEFETIIGFGLLTWSTPNGQTVRRHLVTVQATISLDPNRGTLSVSIPADGPRPMLEQDMLEASQRPPADLQIKVEEMVNQLADDVWNNTFVEVAARSWIQSVSSEGQYDSVLNPPSSASKTPTATYAPALILRKRTERGLLRLFQEIINQLKKGDSRDIPLGITRTVEIVDDNPEFINSTESDSGNSQIPQEVYFPLPVNDDQLRIDVSPLFRPVLIG